MKQKNYRTDVRTDSEYGKIPEVAVLQIDEAAAKEIVALAGLVNKHGLHKVEKFDWRVNYYSHDPEEDPEAASEAGDENVVATECDCLSVSDTDFWYSAYLKHSSVEILTEHLSIHDLASHFGIEFQGGGV